MHIVKYIASDRDRSCECELLWIPKPLQLFTQISIDYYKLIRFLLQRPNLSNKIITCKILEVGILLSASI